MKLLRRRPKGKVPRRVLKKAFLLFVQLNGNKRGQHPIDLALHRQASKWLAASPVHQLAFLQAEEAWNSSVSQAAVERWRREFPLPRIPAQPRFPRSLWYALKRKCYALVRKAKALPY